MGDADIYSLSCDAGQPPLHIDEVNDHVLVIKRKVAKFFGMYFTNLYKDKDMVQKCTSSLKEPFDDDDILTRGCNKKMLLKWMIDQNNFSVRKVGQSYIPFQRSIHLRTDSKNEKKERDINICFHKYCQSYENKLD